MLSVAKLDEFRCVAINLIPTSHETDSPVVGGAVSDPLLAAEIPPQVIIPHQSLVEPSSLQSGQAYFLF